MNFADYQRAAARTSDPSRDQRDRLSNAALGLAGETGEVVELVKKHLHHGHDLDGAKLARELGDVLWYIAETCNVLGLDLASVARANVAKLQQRYPEGFSAQASRERVDVVPQLEVEHVDGSGKLQWIPVTRIVSVRAHRRGHRRGWVLMSGQVCWWVDGVAATSMTLGSFDAAIAALDAWLTHGTVPGTLTTTPPHIPADASLLATLTTAQEHIREALVSAQEAQDEPCVKCGQVTTWHDGPRCPGGTWAEGHVTESHGRRLYEVGAEYVSADVEHTIRDGFRRGVVHESREVPGSFEVVVRNSSGTGARDYATYGEAEAAMIDWLGPGARKAAEVCEGRR